MTQAANLAALGTNASSTGILPIAGGGTAGTGGAIGFKNRIINGNMAIAQRGTSSLNVDNSDWYYPVDRFSAYHSMSSGSKFSVQQNAGSVTPPIGFNYYIGATVTSAYSVTGSDWAVIRQTIEGFNVADLGFGTANAKTFTASFWVRSSLTGTFGGAFYNNDGSRSYPYTYTINTANTWEYKTITVVGDTSGTWNSTNNGGITIEWSMGTGPTLSGPAGAWASAFYASATGVTNILATNGATLYITGVQLEVGTAATNFDVRSYGTELMLCQRYYWKWSQTAPDANTGNWLAFGWGSNWGTNTATMIRFPVPLRSAASVTLSAANTFGRHAPGIVAEVASTANSYYADTNSMNLLITSATSLSNGVGGQVNVAGSQTAFVAVSAEL